MKPTTASPTTLPPVSPRTTVIFRTWRDDGTVIALFPEIPATVQGHCCLSYQHLGQHESANPDLHGITRASFPEEVEPLKRELEAIGYKLEIRKRVSPAMNAKRYAAAKDAREGKNAPEIDRIAAAKR